MKQHAPKHSNISRQEREAIKNLSDDATIIIRQADKGGAITILNYTYYAREMYSQLLDGVTYSLLPCDPTSEIMAKFEKSIQRGLSAGHINEDLFQYLLKPHPRTPVVYGIPKIHKDPVAPPLRPIVSATGGVIEPTAKWLDFLFKAPVQCIPTCIKDTNDFLQRLKSVVVNCDEVVFMTLDVKSLYTVIPHGGGLEAMRWLLSNSVNYDGPCVEFVLELLALALENNYFRFEDKWYLQRTGMSMGAAMAPMYANAYMYKFEIDNILTQFPDKIVEYVRFIDDIFILWRGTVNEAREIEQCINNLDTPIKVTSTVNEHSINFLDVRVFKKDNCLQYSLFSKPTDRNTLLHEQSAHPEHLKRSLPYSQLLRVIRNNSDVTTREEQISDMCRKFSSRGYSETVLTAALERARAPRKEKSGLDRFKFPLTFDTGSNKITSVVRRNWSVLEKDQNLPETFRHKPMFCYRKNRSLKDFLVKADPIKSYDQNQNQFKNLGCKRCLGCVTCGHMIPSKEFRHPHTGKRYFIRHLITCRTEFVVYKILCPCGLAYVGKTTTQLCERIRNHRSNIRIAYRDGRSDKPVARHFLQCGHPLSSLKFLAIDHVPPPRRGGDRALILLQREAQWIHRLDTVFPRGLNERNVFSAFL
uniref:Reverse transcriptase domain-containing protein n=1 Tax=Leptobrachium leishanense TaxID=445787 RepID=A0A8C5M435_9ANUR